MKNRKDKDIENILDEFAYYWNLSIKEEDALDSFLNVLKDGNVLKLTQVDHLFNGEYDELLETIPDNVAKRYCENRLGMVTHEYMNDVLDEDYNLSLENLNLYELCQLAEDRGYEILEKEKTSVVEDMQMREMKELFLTLSCAEKEELLNKLRK